jgi:glycosyltransferase involved in cell wall biosynthesis
LTIALDATYSIGESPSGVGVYSRELLAGLPAAHPEARFQLCYRPHRLWRAMRQPALPNSRRSLLMDHWAPRSADLFHGLNQRLPRARLRHAVCTFHDLFVLTGDYSTAEFRERFGRQAREAAARAERIVAVSAFTASQVHELLGVNRERLHVVHHGVRRLPLPAVERERIVLHVGAIQRRKNLTRLVEAFESLDASWRLVLAGSAGYGAPEILRRIENSAARERIRVTGYLSPEELGRCYASAMIFAFPSLDEGFGMPVLEAMAAGVPVLTSNRSALPEVSGDAAVQVEPEDTGALTAALERLSREEDLRQELIRRGFQRAARFTWEAAVAATWAVYRDVLG